MTKKYRVALIGAGIAERHLFGYSWIKDLFDVRVLCSLDEERGRPLAEKYGVPEYTQDTDSLFAREDIDIIDICTPPANHFELCERALAAGKHVICEKPLFGSLADCDRMEQILARTDRKFMPIFQYRYGTGLQKLKMLVDRGLTGRPIMTTIETHWWRGPDYYAVPWRGKWATELGGGLLGHAIHAHDMLSYIQGPIAEVFSFGATLVNPIEVEDTAALSVRLANGSLATLSMTLGSREEISRLRFCFLDLAAESTTAALHDVSRSVEIRSRHPGASGRGGPGTRGLPGSRGQLHPPVPALPRGAGCRERAPGYAAGRPGLPRTRVRCLSVAADRSPDAPADRARTTRCTSPGSPEPTKGCAGARGCERRELEPTEESALPLIAAVKRGHQMFRFHPLD